MEATTSDGAGKRENDRLILLRQRLAESPESVALIVFILVFIFFAFSAPHFLTVFALSNILTFSSVFGIVVVGVAFLMISGEFDLSVGSVLALAGFVFLIALRADVPPLIAMLLALGISAILGLINGLIVILFRIPSFIATLGTMLAYRGIVRALGAGQVNSYTPETKPALFAFLNGFATPINKLFEPAGNFRVSSLWFIGVAIVMSFVLMRTRHGNWSIAVGGNSPAALAQAVNVTRVKLTNFTLSGLFAGLAGVILFAQRSSTNELVGFGLELTAVASAVIGGVVLTGGAGTIIGAALGILLLSMLEQGLVLMGVTNELFQGVLGAIIIVSVVINVYLKRQDR